MTGVSDTVKACDPAPPDFNPGCIQWRIGPRKLNHWYGTSRSMQMTMYVPDDVVLKASFGGDGASKHVC